jgi:hypothetical protein
MPTFMSPNTYLFLFLFLLLPSEQNSLFRILGKSCIDNIHIEQQLSPPVSEQSGVPSTLNHEAYVVELSPYPASSSDVFCQYC